MRKRMAVTAAAILLAMAPFAAPDLAADVHFGLAKSSPEADASVTSVEEVRLWFTQVPQNNSVSIRLIDAHGDLVESSEPAQDADDGTVYSISLDHSPTPGAYTVSWRGIGDDGHVVTGDYAFTVVAR